MKKNTLIGIACFMSLFIIGLSPTLAQQQERPILRIVYFLPHDRQPEPEIDERIDRVIKQVQQHYANEMDRLGYGKKTFKLETDRSGKVVVHRMKGKLKDVHYRGDTFNIIAEELSEQYDTSKDVYFVAANTAVGFDSGVPGRGPVCGKGSSFTLVRSSGECFTTDSGSSVAAHELGHTFGLQHDFRNDTYLMSYGGGGNLSPCDAEWLDVHRAFNPSRPTANKHPTFEMLPPSLVTPPNVIRFRFKLTDPDGIHQARLHTTTLTGPALGFPEIVSCKGLNGNPSIIAELVTTYLGVHNKSVSLQVIDVNGNFTMSKAFRVNLTSVMSPSRVVSIPDSNLAAAVRQEIGNSITTHTLQNLTRLDAPNRGIKNLIGLQHAHNLRYLNLGAEYSEAKRRIVNANAISDLSLLSNFAHLKNLDLTAMGISDIPSLTNLTQLTELYLAYNSISDIAPLADIRQLGSLNLSYNPISNITPLADLTQLTQLHLTNNNISDIAPLAELRQLRTLNLSYNPISDIAPLAELKQLIQLTLVGNSVSDISPLSRLTQLIYLNLSYNEIVDVTALANLTHLTTLQLYSNSIFDVSPLVGLELPGTQWNNTGLYIEGNPLNYVSVHTHIPAMQAKGVGIQFDNRAHSALVKASGDTQEAKVGSRLAVPLVVKAMDPHGAAIKDRSIRFQVIEGGGSLSAITVTTDANGRAETTLTLGRIPSVNKVRVTAPQITYPVTFTAIATKPSRLATDVNADGRVNIQDLVLVSSSFGQTGESRADVNGDGKVNIADLVLVAGGFNSGAATAPALHPSILSKLSRADIERWLDEAKQLDKTDVMYLRGIAILEQLLIALIPKETTLLANYPNPFNPETWIPYQLAKPANVTLHIYLVNGKLVRTLALGHQPAGVYQTRSRAAYWDGRNDTGEVVASGIYFYTLSAGNFAATQKMLIRK